TLPTVVRPGDEGRRAGRGCEQMLVRGGRRGRRGAPRRHAAARATTCTSPECTGSGGTLVGAVPSGLVVAVRHGPVSTLNRTWTDVVDAASLCRRTAGRRVPGGPGTRGAHRGGLAAGLPDARDGVPDGWDLLPPGPSAG